MKDSFPAGLELATILRDYRTVHNALLEEQEGPIEEIQNAYRYCRANLLWPKWHAVRVAFRANMEAAQSHGDGSKAARRLIRVRAEALGVSPADYEAYVKDQAEMEREEAQRHTRAWYESNVRREAVEAEHEAPV